MESIVEALSIFANERPDRTAVIADDEQITYAELWKEVQGFAEYLKKLGFPKGSRITVKAEHSIWFAVSCFGIHLSGNVHVPMEKTIGVEGIRNIAQELDASLIISDIGVGEDGYFTAADGNGRNTDGSSADNAASEGNRDNSEHRYLCISSKEVRNIARANYSEGLKFDLPTLDMTCDIMFTTGTTGKSKGVMESHRAVVAVSENVQYGADIPKDNIYLVPAPINHASALRKLYVSILTGTTVVLLDGFTDIKKFFAYIEKYHVTSILMPPAAVHMILLLAAKELGKYSDQLHHIHTGSAAFPETDKEKLCEILPHTRLYFAYGSSEAGCVSMYDYSANRGLISCVGKPNRNANIFIVDENHNPIKSSKTEQGLIAISGGMVMQGYYNEPELTAGVLKDGIVYTNDIGYIDEEGYVYMLGRQGDVINLGGLKIAPAEVENVVLRFPGVNECACFAVEDRMGRTIPKLNVIMKKGCELDTAALKQYMQAHLEAFKVPKQIEIVEELPKTSNGKLDRKRLK
ncbi:MAG: acyl--CoA ligase [Lachnospiraceae bacterium]|nr:acyl--CoA ligase [Lachnospiraceae bacterium]